MKSPNIWHNPGHFGGIIGHPGYLKIRYPHHLIDTREINTPNGQASQNAYKHGGRTAKMINHIRQIKHFLSQQEEMLDELDEL